MDVPRKPFIQTERESTVLERILCENLAGIPTEAETRNNSDLSSSQKQYFIKKHREETDVCYNLLERLYQ